MDGQLSIFDLLGDQQPIAQEAAKKARAEKTVQAASALLGHDTLAEEVEAIKGAITPAVAEELAYATLYLAIETLKSVSPARKDWQEDAAWVFGRPLPGAQGLTFDQVVNHLIEARPEEMGDIATPEELRVRIYDALPERAQRAIDERAF